MALLLCASYSRRFNQAYHRSDLDDPIERVMRPRIDRIAVHKFHLRDRVTHAERENFIASRAKLSRYQALAVHINMRILETKRELSELSDLLSGSDECDSEVEILDM